MRRDVFLGLALCGLGVASGIAVAAFFVLRAETVPGSMLVASAGLVFLGVVMIFFDGLESGLLIRDEIDCLPELIQDDFEDLKVGRITATHGMILITVLTLLGHILTLFLFRKWQASWFGGLSVVAVAAVVAFVVGLFGISMNWFQERKCRLSWWVFLIPFVAYGLSALLGVHFTEPRVNNARGLPINQGSGYEYVWAASRTGQDAAAQGVELFGSGWDIDCDDEGCLVLILVVIAIACVVASATIPHFWVVATTILWVIMLLISLRELFFTRSQPEVEGGV
jgi:hypothetical protein